MHMYVPPASGWGGGGFGWVTLTRHTHHACMHDRPRGGLGDLGFVGEVGVIFMLDGVGGWAVGICAWRGDVYVYVCMYLYTYALHRIKVPTYLTLGKSLLAQESRRGSRLARRGGGLCLRNAPLACLGNLREVRGVVGTDYFDYLTFVESMEVRYGTVGVSCVRVVRM